MKRTHLHLDRNKNEWSCTSILPTHRRGVILGTRLYHRAYNAVQFTDPLSCYHPAIFLTSLLQEIKIATFFRPSIEEARGAHLNS